MRVATASVILGVAAFLLAGAGNFTVGQDKKEPKYNIKQVMKMAHAGGEASLRAKVLSKTASAAEKEKLIELYTALSMNEPPQGDAKAFQKQAKQMLDAAKGAAKGDEKAIKRLAKLTTCGACHKKFKS